MKYKANVGAGIEVLEQIYAPTTDPGYCTGRDECQDAGGLLQAWRGAA